MHDMHTMHDYMGTYVSNLKYMITVDRAVCLRPVCTACEHLLQVVINRPNASQRSL